VTSSRRLLSLLTLSLAALAPASALAQRSAGDLESARQLYNQGMELRDKGDTKGALEKLKAAHALGNTPITGVELCKTYAALRMPVEAREVCLGVARIPPLGGETPRSQEARAEAARVAEEVKAKLASLRVRLTGVPQGREATVTVDGASVPAAALGEPRAIDPGTHEVAARVGQGPESRARFDVREGETKDLALTVQVPVDEPQPQPPPGGLRPGDKPPEKEKKSVLPTVGFVVAGVSAGIGAAAGLAAMSSKSDLDRECANKLCGPAEHDALDRAKAIGNVSTVFFIIAGVGAGVGIYGLVSSASSSKGNSSARTPSPKRVSITPDIGPTGVGVHGTF
jgi:hypothetical protein